MDPQKIIGDTVYNPETVQPLAEGDCRLPIPKPTFYIVGGAKCGSTMLTSVLASHPDCCHSVPKETNFFTLNFDQGWDWYRGTFSHYTGQRVIGEASVSYGSTPFRKNVVEQLYQYTPDAKIIYMVRHPYHKLVSGWKMATSGPGFLAHRSAMQGFEPYVLHEEPRHEEGGPWSNPTHGWKAAEPANDSMTRVWLDALHYQGQIENYTRQFPREQIRVVFLEDWRANPIGQAAEVCEFLDLDPAKLPPQQEKPVNRADERKKVLPLFRFVANSALLRPLRHLFPPSIRQPIRTALFQSRMTTRRLKYPAFTVSDGFRNDLRAYLKEKSKLFLDSQGKPDSFWNFDQT